MSATVTAVTANISFDETQSFDDNFRNERAHREAMSDSILSFGVPFLDESLGGIHANDLVVLGAATGLGKTQLATLIAKSNVLKGKRVLFFALEAEPFEIERRIKYQLIADEFYKMPIGERPKLHLNYLDWYYGRFKYQLAEIESRLEQLPSVLPTLRTFYRTRGDFTHKDFHRIFTACAENIDLAVVDHIHFFDYDDQNENRAVKEIIKTIRDVALCRGKPVLLLSHVRKMDRKMKVLVPAIEDFHGSSDIGKIATKAITVAPSPSSSVSGTIKETLIRTLKCRVDGSRKGHTAQVGFNIRTQQYTTDYVLGTLSAGEDQFVVTDESNLPYWAYNAKRGNQ
jgi:hypothetical protein